MPRIVGDLLGRGLRYPFTTNNSGGVLMNSGIERINQSLSTLFDTDKGSRLMQPEYGSEIQKYRFDPFDEVLIDKLDISIKESIRLWEPRIVLDDIEYKTSPEDRDSHILYIQLRYHIINTDVEGNFVYPYRLGTQSTYVGRGVYGKYE